MKKFITTKEHPIFKEGIELREAPSHYSSYPFTNECRIEFLIGNDAVLVPKPKFTKWLEKGWIKEVEENEI